MALHSQSLPTVGEWYRAHAGQKCLFEVIDVDERSGTIATQWEDGDLDEFDEDTWQRMSPALTVSPSEWRDAPNLDTGDTVQYDNLPLTGGDEAAFHSDTHLDYTTPEPLEGDFLDSEDPYGYQDIDDS